MAAKKPQDGVNVLTVINHPELAVHEISPSGKIEKNIQAYSQWNTSKIAFISSRNLVIIIQLQEIKRVHA
tara:strand:+ start:1628 stop:1837 length:210 start_codon:yes stop_codon:yes gene_type:complete